MLGQLVSYGLLALGELLEQGSEDLHLALQNVVDVLSALLNSWSLENGFDEAINQVQNFGL